MALRWRNHDASSAPAAGKGRGERSASRQPLAEPSRPAQPFGGSSTGAVAEHSPSVADQIRVWPAAVADPSGVINARGGVEVVRVLVTARVQVHGRWHRGNRVRVWCRTDQPRFQRDVVTWGSTWGPAPELAETK